MLIALDCLFVDRKTTPKDDNNDIAKVMGATADNPGMQLKQTGEDIQQVFYNSTPLQFLYKYACDKAGNIDLNVIEETHMFKWACVAANLVVRDTGKANMDLCKIRVKSNWKVENLEKDLCNYDNKEMVEMIKYGFPIESTADEKGSSRVSQNHKGAVEFPQQIRNYLQQEIEAKTLIGPFDHNPFGEDARFSPLNSTPKKDSAQCRIIMDLSWPLEQGSVNSGINKSFYRGKPVKCKLPTIQNLIEIVRKKGKFCLIFKKDLKSMYKQIPVCVAEIHVLGYYFEGHYYFDITLPMGLKNLAFICQMVTDTIMYIYNKEGYEGVNYLDDLGNAEVEQLAWQAYEVLGEILQSLGVIESVDKACPPSTLVVFLGILFNTVLMRIEITKE